MSHRIQLALVQALARIIALFFPFAEGDHRSHQSTRPPHSARTPRTSPRTPAALRRLSVSTPPGRRIPADTPTLDDPGPLVRPYLLAHEQQAQRAALALALDGIDVGPWVIHGTPCRLPRRVSVRPGAARPVMAGVAA